MSQENVELVRSTYVAYNEGDWEVAGDGRALVRRSALSQTQPLRHAAKYPATD